MVTDATKKLNIRGLSDEEVTALRIRAAQKGYKGLEPYFRDIIRESLKIDNEKGKEKE